MGIWDIRVPEDLQEVRPNVIAMLSCYSPNSGPRKGASVVTLLRGSLLRSTHRGRLRSHTRWRCSPP
eukprot:6827766-Pyramimonas_sp.AAC.1